MKYYIPDYGETAGDAEEIKPAYKNQSFSTYPDEYATDAALYIHSNRDGWEASWPMVIVVIDEEGKEHWFSVEREYEPVFSVYEKESKDE